MYSFGGVFLFIFLSNFSRLLITNLIFSPCSYLFSYILLKLVILKTRFFSNVSNNVFCYLMSGWVWNIKLWTVVTANSFWTVWSFSLFRTIITSSILVCNRVVTFWVKKKKNRKGHTHALHNILFDKII